MENLLVTQPLRQLVEGITRGRSLAMQLQRAADQHQQAQQALREREQLMSARDIGTRMELNDKARSVSPSGTIDQSFTVPAVPDTTGLGIGGGVRGPERVEFSRPVDPARTVQYGGGSYELRNPDELLQRSVERAKAMAEPEIWQRVEAGRRLRESMLASNGVEVPMPGQPGRTMRLLPGELDDVGRYNASLRPPTPRIEHVLDDEGNMTVVAIDPTTGKPIGEPTVIPKIGKAADNRGSGWHPFTNYETGDVTFAKVDGSSGEVRTLTGPTGVAKPRPRNPPRPPATPKQPNTRNEFHQIEREEYGYTTSKGRTPGIHEQIRETGEALQNGFMVDSKGDKVSLNAIKRNQLQSKYNDLVKRRDMLLKRKVELGYTRPEDTRGAGSGQQQTVSKGRLTDANIAADYLKRAGGDKAKARQLAAMDGWEF